MLKLIKLFLNVVKDKELLIIIKLRENNFQVLIRNIAKNNPEHSNLKTEKPPNNFYV